MIRVEEIKIIPYDFTSEDTDYLLGVKDERVSVEIKFIAEWFIISSTTVLTSFSTNAITITDEDGDPIDNYWAANEFKVGDILTITNSTSNNITTGEIISFGLNGSTAVFAGSPFVVEADSTTAILYGVTPLTGVSFKYNFIENNAAIDYNSLIDGNENKYSLSGLSVSLLAYTDLNHQGNFKSNKIGSVQIKSTETLNEFILLQDINIVPFALAGQLSDIQNGIAPVYYFDLACLKYIYEITLHRTLLNPNVVHVSSPLIFQLGNTGNFNENFNAGTPEYSLTSTVFKDLSDVVIATPDFTKVNKVEITLNSATGKFTNTLQKFTIQHALIPVSTSEYVNTSTDVETNFMFDQQVTTIEAASVNGRGFGTDKQVLTNIEVSYINANTAVVTAQIDLSTYYKTKLGLLDSKYFYLGVTTQNKDLATEQSDKVHVLCSSIAYTQDLSDAGSATIETDFLGHPSTDVTDETLNRTGVGNFVEDWQIGRSIFSIDTANEATAKDVTVRIYASHSTYGDFNLELKSFNVSAAPIVSGVQVIAISGERGYKMEVDNIFNDYSIQRRSDLDAGGFSFYELLYNFKIRWEDFISLPGASSQFFDPLEPQNGKNNDWSRYYSGAGWTLKYEVALTVTKNGFDNSIVSESVVTALAYGAATDWTYYTKTFDLLTGNEITGNVMADRDTIVKIYFTKISGDPPTLADVTGLIGIAPTNAGGDKVIREISLPHGKESDSPWVSITNDNLLKIEKVGVEYILSAILSYSQLISLFPSATAFDITGRIEELNYDNGKLFGDGSHFIFGDESQYLFGL